MRLAIVFAVVMVAAGWSSAQAPTSARGGYIVEHDADVQKAEPGTHDGGGQTVGYSFFAKAPKLALVFRKRALEPGSGIGYHLQKEDEIYYVLSGRGMMTHRRQDVRGGSRHRGAHQARQLAWLEADRRGGPRHHDQLRAESGLRLRGLMVPRQSRSDRRIGESSTRTRATPFSGGGSVFESCSATAPPHGKVLSASRIFLVSCTACGSETGCTAR